MTAATEQRRVSLLQVDPDLGVGLNDEDRAQVERLVRVPLLALEVGPWAPDAGDHATLGVLLLDGLVTSNVVLGDCVTSQIIGTGDVLQTVSVPDALLPVEITHYVNERGRAAVLDRTFIAAVRRWPALLLTLHERIRVQERRLAVYAAIAKLSRAEDRVLALLWHLAERWGRVTPDGTVVPIALTHETIGRLVGAKRPTVSLALNEMRLIGEVTRREDGAYVLSEASLRRLAASQPMASVPGMDAVRTEDVPRPRLVDHVALQARLAGLHEALPD